MDAPLREPVLLTPLDNFVPQVGQYTRKILFFSNPGNDRDAIARHMRNAFARMMDAIPWIAGTVTDIKHEHQHGRLAIAAPWKTLDDLLTVNHLNYLNYAELKAQHFPIQSLLEEELWPQSQRTARPTLQAQINFIQSGIILAARAAHSVTDGTGLLTILNVWAAYCRGEDGSLLLGPDSLDRGRLMSGPAAKLGDSTLYTELPPSRKQAPGKGLTHTLSKSCEWVSTRMRTGLVRILRTFSDLITYRSIRMALRARKAIDEGPRQTEVFFFSAARLRELKEAVTSSGNADEKRASKAWISTHDAVISLLWCCITQSWNDGSYFDRDSNPDPLRRLLWQIALRTTRPISVLRFYVDCRRFVKDPPLRSYLGNIVLPIALGGAFGDVGSTLDAVARYAYAIRRKFHEVDESLLMHSVGAFAAVPDITRIRLSRGAFPESRISVNSLAAMNHYGTDWGREVGGRPERVRVAPFSVYPLCLVLPKIDAKDGWREEECGLEVVVSLQRAHMGKLRRDPLFQSWAEWRCS
ncbi:MAG: hypothetical protein ALECFALPRED_009119 [Alectoria fallacina]|uniref:Trichothecene 3-O-acetyltransferase-like N-terminal domain-containing protein n=1 Tax=Alectoria fallacina TaxID=1903189 RepID=A0A8H3F141_9LECA|nr:MAG: hypothetical protein ALECFALPRED_009119 [Alectoria fallacina]